ncbi:MAG: DUF4124 domain-containing protein [Proteobacteria bacterium]|nr:DUF4124 domain-containing protein [Pseudomonadota bacterium]
MHTTLPGLKRHIKILKKSTPIILLFMISLSDIAYSQTIYQWVDKQGNKHFTSDYNSIPPEYRDQSRKPEGIGEIDTPIEIPPGKKAVDSPDIPTIGAGTKVQPAPTLVQGEKKPPEIQKRTPPKLEFEGSFWITDLTAEAKVTNSIIGTDIDLKADLGIEDENLLDLRVVWHTGPRTELRLAYTRAEYSGDENIARTLEFGGETFTAGARVITDVDIEYIRFGWTWQFVDIANGTVKFGPLLEAKGFLLDMSLEAPSLIPPVEESEKFAGALPTVGAVLDINPHKVVNVFAEISGIYAGKYGHFFDGEAGVKIIPIKYLTVVGGWRLLDLKIEDDPDFAELRLSGPFVGATLRF